MLVYHFGGQASSLAVPMCNHCFASGADIDYLRAHRLTAVSATLVPWRDWPGPEQATTRVLTHDPR